jgi:lipoprotein-releasing system ATP-binding protein
MGGDKLLVVRDVHKRFATAAQPVEVLCGVSFELGEGEALAVTGPSGSGKSTLLHLIGSLDRPTSGTIAIDGTDPFGLAEPELAWFRNRTIGFVFQDSHLLPQYTVLENVLVPAVAFPGRGDSGAAEARAKELLARVGLDHRLHHRPAELSGGERQRTAVARALLNRPRLLLCDEPTGSLDRTAAAAVADLLFDLHAAERTGLVVVTHSLDLAARFARRCELVEGRCLEPSAA